MATLVTPFGLLSFPQFFKAKPPVDGADPRYSGNLVFDEAAQQTDEYKALKQAVADCAREKWGDKMPKNLRTPLRDAGEKDYNGYEDGHIFISAWSKNAPGIVGPSLQDILAESDVFAGQKARFTVTPFAYDNSGNRGVSLGLQNVQIGKFDMPRMDGRVSADKAFDAVDGGGEAASTASDGVDDDPFA